MVHPRTTTMLMGLAGLEQWRTSTLSTKRPMAGFSHVFSGLEVTWDNLVMVKKVQILGSPVVLFVCFVSRQFPVALI